MAIVVFEHSELSGVGRLGDVLRGYGHRLRMIRLHRGEPMPPDLDGVDAVISCGGPQSANDELPWLDGEIAFLQAAHERELAVIGICLGSQIVGRALGGEVAPMNDGQGARELGWPEVTLTDAGREDPIHVGIPWTSRQISWHGEWVAKTPPGARVLASSAACAVQAWALGLRTYAFQYHPEADPAALMSWAADEPEALRETGQTPEGLREESRRHYPAFERVSSRLMESIALYLIPADRLVKGRTKDLHH